MTLTLPDHPATRQISDLELRTELACALFARGRITALAGAEIAGLAYGEFLDALRERGISRYTEAMLAEDITSLNTLFPDSPLPLPVR
jgi:predicted HTH domain antitoxin